MDLPARAIGNGLSLLLGSSLPYRGEVPLPGTQEGLGDGHVEVPFVSMLFFLLTCVSCELSPNWGPFQRAG